MLDLMVGDERLNLCPTAGCKVAIDSGTSLLTGPSKHIAKVMRKLDVAHDCSTWDDVKPMTLLLEVWTEYISPKTFSILIQLLP